MSKDQLRTLDYLEHIREAIERIQRYTKEMTRDSFLKNEMVQDAVIRNIEILGEASNNIKKNDPDIVEQHKDIPWAVVYAMRNRVAHAYHQVDLEIVWKTIQADLPKLSQQVVELIELIGGDSETPTPS